MERQTATAMPIMIGISRRSFQFIGFVQIVLECRSTLLPAAQLPAIGTIGSTRSVLDLILDLDPGREPGAESARLDYIGTERNHTPI